jgi:hypothetical protein
MAKVEADIDRLRDGLAGLGEMLAGGEGVLEMRAGSP